jgi:type IV pilus assembly protein PilM
MTAETGTVWAIDIGNNSLKALCLSTERGVAEVIGFENIQHGKILSGNNVTQDEREELIAISLRELVTKYDLSMEDIIVSVPSQNSFVRFVNLPPVEAKRIPEMVKFEAVQQIPFGINDVQWDWQLMSETDSPEIKVGIFAIKNEIVDAALKPLNREDIDASYVQIAPMALYNYLLYDRPDLFGSDNQAVVILNVGAENSDLVVCTKSMVWQRCILIGGNAFTQAIADTFKLNFDKAEKLKRTAPMSKYARQVFQAMRPVFTDLASEVQRSLGFYNSSNPNTKIKKIIAMGGGAKLRGLGKYLQQTIQIPVERPDTFKKVALGQGVSQAKFHESVTDFGIVYGLAIQGLGMAKIESNLLPRTVARAKAWASKSRYFITAACLLLAVSVISLGRTFWDKMQYNKQDNIRQSTKREIQRLETASTEFDDMQTKIRDLNSVIDNEFKVFDYRDTIPKLFEIIISALPNEKNNPKQADLYKAFASGNAEEVKKIPRNKRKQLFITNMVINFTFDLKNTQFPEIDFTQDESLYRAPSTQQPQNSALAERLRMEREMSSRNEPVSQETIKMDPGFLVIITGYCPYGNNITDVFSLLDPKLDIKSTDGNRENWGFVTRLEYIDKVTDANIPFKLYDKIDPKNYAIDVKELFIKDKYPVGTGIKQTKTYSVSFGSYRQYTESTDIPLIDPLTKEIISATLESEENGKEIYQIHDYWFTLKLKILWKNAPEPPAITAGK